MLLSRVLLAVAASLTCSCQATSARSAATPDPARLTLADKQAIVREINTTLATKAFVSTVDFLDPTPKLRLSDGAVDSAATPGAFVALVNAQFRTFGVSHLELETPEERQRFVAGRDVGAGVLWQRDTEGGVTGLRVHQVMPGSAADAAGVRVWDLIVAVDGTPVDGAATLGGAEGARKTIELLRDGARVRAVLSYRSFSPYTKPTLTWLTKDVALIPISTFTASGYDATRVDSLFTLASGATAIILDVRYNRGGALDNVFDLLGHIFPDSVVIGRRIDREVIARSGRAFRSTRDAFEELQRDPASEVRLSTKHRPYKGTVIVLTSHLAGSGGDRFPGTVKDLGRGTLVGRRTIGALLTGDRATLTRGYHLLYPSAEVLMPSGFRIEGVGVEPHVTLSAREVLDDATVFATALQVLGRTRN